MIGRPKVLHQLQTYAASEHGEWMKLPPMCSAPWVRTSLDLFHVQRTHAYMYGANQGNDPCTTTVKRALGVDRAFTL